MPEHRRGQPQCSKNLRGGGSAGPPPSGYIRQPEPIKCFFPNFPCIGAAGGRRRAVGAPHSLSVFFILQPNHPTHKPKGQGRSDGTTSTREAGSSERPRRGRDETRVSAESSVRVSAAAMAALLCRLLREPPGGEKEQLDEFLLQYGQRYDFSGASALQPAHESFGMVFQLLVQERFLSQANWERLQPRDCQLRVLQCMRVLMRDNTHRTLFADLGGVSKLVGLFGQLADEHFQGQAEFGSEMLVETLSILKRFATHESADEYRLQRMLVALLSTREVRPTCMRGPPHPATDPPVDGAWATEGGARGAQGCCWQPCCSQFAAHLPQQRR